MNSMGIRFLASGICWLALASACSKDGVPAESEPGSGGALGAVGGSPSVARPDGGILADAGSPSVARPDGGILADAGNDASRPSSVGGVSSGGNSGFAGQTSVGGGGAEPSLRRPTAAEKAAAKTKIETFLASRDQATLPSAAPLGAELSTQGFTGEEVEALVRSGPVSYPAISPASPEADGGESVEPYAKRTADCYHVNYSSTYWQYVPPAYDPTKPTALVVVGHGGNSSMDIATAESTAEMYISSYLGLAGGDLKAILVAPATTVGWNPIGDSLIEGVISQTIRSFNIDPDRIYITGQSMGGHLSWRSATNHGDRFAAFSPQSGGYSTYIDDHLIENVFGTFGYVTYGTTEPYGLAETNDLLGAWLTEHHYPWTVVKKSGGHEIYADEIPKVASFFAAHRRDLYPPRTYFHAVGELRYPNTGASAALIRPGRSLRWNFRNWIEVDPRPDLPTGATFYGENKGNNRLEIQSDGVRHLTVLLHPKLVDLKSPVTILVNGEVKYQAIPKIDVAQMLDRVREFDDRGRVYYAAVPLDVTTDHPVAIPTYP